MYDPHSLRVTHVNVTTLMKGSDERMTGENNCHVAREQGTTIYPGQGNNIKISDSNALYDIGNY